MPSLAQGDFRLVGAIQGSSPTSWYRQLIHTHQPRRPDGRYNLSCDCASWLSNQSGDRACKHTAITAQILDGTPLAGGRPLDGQPLTIRTVIAMQPLLQGIHGQWCVTECQAPIKGAPYRVSLIDVTLPQDASQHTPVIASAFIALAERANPTLQDVSAAVAAWAGWSVAAEVARLSGFGQVGAPPDHHYRFQRGAGRGGRGDQVGVYDLLQIGNRADLGDGLTPQQRAEHCLRMFLGPLYATLQQQGFLDVSSKLSEGLVYRLRLDPQRRVDRRLRVFERGVYRRDLCIVRLDRQIPVQDAFLTIFLGLLSDEREVLRVVGRHNIFQPYSDSGERETVPALWMPRAQERAVA